MVSSLRRRPGLWAGSSILALLVLAALGGSLSQDPDHLDLVHRLEPPSSRHWLGTDSLGRDVAARVMHGARASLAVGLLAAGFSLLLGVPLGAFAGYRGGWPDAAVSRILEALLCFPTLLLLVALMAFAPPWLVGLPDVIRIALVLGVTGWIPVARFLRAEFLRLRGSEMVLAARACGLRPSWIALRHVLPSAIGPSVVTAAFTVGGAIVTEAALSFLGLGLRPPAASWGGLLTEGREQIERAWWLIFFPGASLFLTVLGCNLVGEGLRDYLDPRTG